MDLFKYKAAVKEIETTKYVKDLKELIRKYTSLIPDYYNLEENHIYYYKLLTFSLLKFEEKSSRKLPDFIYEKKDAVQEYLLRGIFEAELPDKDKSYRASEFFTKLLTYEQFIDYFEFDDLIKLPTSTYYVEVLNQIIDDNPVHFKVKWNYSLTSFDGYSTELYEDGKVLAYATRYQQVNLADKPKQTIWDSFLEYYTEQAKDNFGDTLDSDITKLEQQLRALNTLKENHEQ